MSDLYDDDISPWSERQAELLRRHAAGARENDAIDWPNVIEEIESVGNEQRFAVESNLVQALIHMLKAKAWPSSLHVPHWQAEARVFKSLDRGKSLHAVHAPADRPGAPIPPGLARLAGYDRRSAAVAGPGRLPVDAGRTACGRLSHPPYLNSYGPRRTFE